MSQPSAISRFASVLIFYGIAFMLPFAITSFMIGTGDFSEWGFSSRFAAVCLEFIFLPMAVLIGEYHRVREPIARSLDRMIIGDEHNPFPNCYP